MGIDVPAHHSGEEGSRGSETHRAGGKVDEVGILRAGRVGLQSAELAQGGEVGAIKVAEKVLDGMEDRRRVRLDGHPVGPVKVVEPQRGHDAHHRCRRGLMPTHLDVAGLGSLVVGKVDHANRKPENPLLDATQRVDWQVVVAHGTSRFMKNPTDFGHRQSLGRDKQRVTPSRHSCCIRKCR